MSFFWPDYNISSLQCILCKMKSNGLRLQIYYFIKSNNNEIKQLFCQLNVNYRLLVTSSCWKI